jgi:hypothetical protein
MLESMAGMERLREAHGHSGGELPGGPWLGDMAAGGEEEGLELGREEEEWGGEEEGCSDSD